MPSDYMTAEREVGRATDLGFMRKLDRIALEQSLTKDGSWPGTVSSAACAEAEVGSTRSMGSDGALPCARAGADRPAIAASTGDGAAGLGVRFRSAPRSPGRHPPRCRGSARWTPA